ncbi:MAG: O-antigen ligase family protein [Ruminococcus sp.]|nr:O-antigen ligase family protein [Ruminococcus sp.]
MIWLFIVASLILSLLPLINKKIDISSYMWLLIPIDAYGISIAGATVKPFMLFALLLPLILHSKNRGNELELYASKGQLLAGVLSILILTQSIFVGDASYTIKAALIIVIVYISAQLYVSCSDCKKSEELSDVFIASCFGCSIIFIVTYFLLQNGIEIDGITTTDRAKSGMFMQLSNMVNGSYIEVYRLRGFAYDPNTMFIQFIFGITACTSRLFKKFSFYYIMTLVMSIFCILLSSSRMGIICCACAIVITLAANINQYTNVKKKVASITSVILLFVSLLVFAISRLGQSMLSSILSTYSNRSSLTDEYGRFSIWKECLEIYWNKSPLFGVGIGQMSKMTVTERMTHNTWLEFICECGIIVGGFAVIYFLTIAVIGWSKTRANHINHPDNTSYLTIVIGYTMTLMSLVSVDNITCSYLWFTALLLLKMAQYAKIKENISLKE